MLCLIFYIQHPLRLPEPWLSCSKNGPRQLSPRWSANWEICIGKQVLYNFITPVKISSRKKNIRLNLKTLHLPTLPPNKKKQSTFKQRNSPTFYFENFSPQKLSNPPKKKHHQWPFACQMLELMISATNGGNGIHRLQVGRSWTRSQNLHPSLWVGFGVPHGVQRCVVVRKG